ncbi:hypothetical protein GALMADRAFT_597560 [Galerina marginata CBS 339.88]|uniref:Uncharacterized protein n=1 Tax=Galerina marginata (strain CBS 339.88) TaxID=685588 RepID=A0A067SVD8_GALM3|nr:hypothetical protein GALMADRAFT_597560 [Galerina marginata CBS 339.88]
MNMDIGYQRHGTAIGDVGIITASGAFDFLFNICLPCDHPFNPPELPENFTPLVISLLDVQNYSEFVGESYLSSASVMKSRTGGLNDLTFESSASEGAILTMPVGSRSEDIANTVRLRNYLATHAESWYNYIVGVRGREIQNGDVRLVIGWDKSKAWGMATFSNTSAHEEPFLLQFRPIEDASAGRTYGWVSSGFAEVRAGPGAEEKVRIRMNDPSQAGVEYQNQCLFIRTLNVNLQGNAWQKLATEFGLAEAEARPNTTFEASFLRPWREENRTGDSSFSGMSSQPTSGSTTEALIAPVETTTEENVPSSDLTQSVQISSVQAALSGHPSNIINETLLKLRPNARMAITEDKDWMSVLRAGDTTLPNAEELFERITETFVISEEDGSY